MLKRLNPKRVCDWFFITDKFVKDIVIDTASVIDIVSVIDIAPVIDIMIDIVPVIDIAPIIIIIMNT